MDDLVSKLQEHESTLRSAPFTELDPATTRAFVVCLARFDGEQDGDTSFSLDDRTDAKFIATLKKLGIPKANIVFLKDDEATTEAVKAALVKHLEESNDGDTLIFYYGSHGHYDPKAKTHGVSSYDGHIEVPWFFETIENEFYGDKVFVFSDTCYSGGFVEEAARRRSNISYGAISSTYSQQVGWSGWRFVNCLIRGFSGDPLVDINQDGYIDFDDLYRFAERYMSFCAEGKPMSTTTGVFSPKCVLAEAAGEKSHEILGSLVEVESSGSWYLSEIIDANDTQVKVHYNGYSDDKDDWVSPNSVRPHQFTRFEPGQAVEIKGSSSGKWFPGRVLAAWRSMHLCRYDGYSEAYDEWFGPSRIRELKS